MIQRMNKCRTVWGLWNSAVNYGLSASLLLQKPQQRVPFLPLYPYLLSWLVLSLMSYPDLQQYHALTGDASLAPMFHQTLCTPLVFPCIVCIARELCRHFLGNDALYTRRGIVVQKIEVSYWIRCPKKRGVSGARFIRFQHFQLGQYNRIFP